MKKSLIKNIAKYALGAIAGAAAEEATRKLVSVIPAGKNKKEQVILEVGKWLIIGGMSAMAAKTVTDAIDAVEEAVELGEAIKEVKENFEHIGTDIQAVADETEDLTEEDVIEVCRKALEPLAREKWNMYYEIYAEQIIDNISDAYRKEFGEEPNIQINPTEV